ncbi:NAD(P)H-dependent flavin oxidoreductase [Tessaracoccus caeni]|uniref:NAD(P)H-dependent flavin oxidoreductase n=1 Tax=Tessaracoccus caeni TaxID=3031239 RepID=UPI0023DA1F94|nr:nitronate monooxygenase [Tessaracoccus caeni]MDF1488624.1 nitronate monooxygenase [Tessaracoccus caeni]
MPSRSLLGSALPLAAAPMAGGPTTVALAEAVARAGGFPFLAAGYKSAEQMAAEIAALRGTGALFGVNLFVPSHEGVDHGAVRAYAQEIAAEAHALGAPLGEPVARDEDGWSEKLAMLLAEPVPVVSLTFGLPDPADIAALRGAGSVVLATVTSAGEAVEAQRAGVDGLIVQGFAAGGHSAVHDPTTLPAPIETHELVALIREVADLPLIAAGGVDGPRAVRRLLEAGAEAVVVGTLFLLADEAGTSATHRAALARSDAVDTVLTRAFTGRPARALRNGFIDRHDAAAPVSYPAVHHLTRPMRQAAALAGDADRLHLWAGTGYRHARPGPVADIIRWLSTAL